MIQRHSGADDAAPIAALNEIVPEAERLAHQTAHHAGGGLWPKRRFRDTGESLVGQRGGYDVKPVIDVSAEPFRVREGFDYVEEIRDGTGPPMHKEQWHRLVAAAFLMDEVNIDSLAILGRDRCMELRKCVDLRFGRPLVETVPPVINQLLHITEIGAVVPTGIVWLIRPTDIGKACLQVV